MKKKRKRYCKTFPNIVLQQRKRKKQMFHNLVNNYGDTSLFQCFYIDKRGFSNSLSGEAFDYCIRRFNK